jgi:hypothetical protein
MALDSTVMYGSRIATGVVVGAAAEVAGFGPAIILANGGVLLSLLGIYTLHRRSARPATDHGATTIAT